MGWAGPPWAAIAKWISALRTATVRPLRHWLTRAAPGATRTWWAQPTYDSSNSIQIYYRPPSLSARCAGKMLRQFSSAGTSANGHASAWVHSNSDPSKHGFWGGNAINIGGDEYEYACFEKHRIMQPWRTPPLLCPPLQGLLHFCAAAVRAAFKRKLKIFSWFIFIYKIWYRVLWSLVFTYNTNKWCQTTLLVQTKMISITANVTYC